MLTQAHIDDAALRLFEAEKKRTQINLLSQQHPVMDMDDAYRIQEAFVRHKKNAGEKQIGWKVGLTSKAMQNALGINIPDSGVLFDHMHYDSGETIPKGHFIEPRIEAEIAFVMKADVTEASEEAILTATDYVSPAIEILDTRIVRRDVNTGQTRSVFDTISDNAANAGIVLGDKRHHPKEMDLRWVGVILKRNGIVEETGLGAAVLDHPLTSMRWLVERLGEYQQRIKAGDVVLSGSLIKFIEAPTGSEFCADFGTFGHVDIAFA